MTPEQLLFSQAIRPHLTKLDRFVAARVENQYVADICSDVLAIAWQKRGEFNLELSSTNLESQPDPDSALQQHLFGFLLTTARYQIKNLERKVGTANRLQPLLVKTGELPSPEDNALAQISVALAFKALNPKERDLLAMFAWDSLTVPQIAVVLGITQNNASVRLNRARTKLKAALAVQGVDLAPVRKISPEGNAA